MRIDDKLVRHVAGLARLTVSEDEIKAFVPQLREVLEAFSKLPETDAEPSMQPVELKNRLREDVEGACLSQEEALEGAQSKDGYFRGPRAI